MYDADTNELWSRVLKGSTLKELRVPVDRGVAGYVFRHGKTVVVGNAYDDSRFNPEVDRRSGFKTRSIIATPLKHVGGKVRGVLQVLDRRVDAFTVEDRALVEGIALQIAAVMDNVLLLEDRAGDLAQPGSGGSARSNSPAGDGGHRCPGGKRAPGRGGARQPLLPHGARRPERGAPVDDHRGRSGHRGVRGVERRGGEGAPRRGLRPP